MESSGYFINLDRSQDRLRAVEAELARAGLLERTRRFSAVDGATLDMAGIEVSRGEAGCLLSHLGVLEAGREDGRHFHVMEDDILLAESFPHHLAAIIGDGLIERFDLIFTDMFVPFDTAIVLDFMTRLDEWRANGTFKVMDGIYFGCTSSYVVNIKSVDKIIRLLRQHIEAGMTTPLDIFWRDQVAAGALNAACLFPFVSSVRISEISGTIQRTDTLDRPFHILALLRSAFYIDTDIDALERMVPPSSGGRGDRLIARLMEAALSTRTVVRGLGDSSAWGRLRRDRAASASASAAMAGLVDGPLCPEHFTSTLPAERARELFRTSVTQVEIEVFSYCNRRCHFCPNSSLDRHSTNHLMDEALYLSILDQLASIDYRGVITYSRYNEPLADRIILTRLAQARQRLPHAILSTNTNGDYLDRDYLLSLRDAGLNRLLIQAYPGNSERFSDAAVLSAMTRCLGKLGFPSRFVGASPTMHYLAVVDVPGIEVSVAAHNFDLMGTDRGQTVTLDHRYHRTAPCPVVFQHFYVDWNGAVVPCCNIRSDQPTHQALVVDRLTPASSIFAVYAGAAMSEWRRRLLTFGEKSAPCDTCAFSVVADEAPLRRRLDEAARLLPPPPIISPPASRNAPCPCGSGKRFKHCHGAD